MMILQIPIIVPAVPIAIIEKLGMIKPIGIRTKKLKTINAWYTAEIIFTARLLKNDKIKGGKNSSTSIPKDNQKPSGSSNETVLGPVGYWVANNNAMIANIIVKNTTENLFIIIKNPL
jgi:hypothetical protein